MKYFYFLRFFFLTMVIAIHAPAMDLKNNTGALVAIGDSVSKMYNALELFTMIGMKYNYKDPVKRLHDIEMKIIGMVGAMENNSNDPAIKKSISKMREDWGPLKKILTSLDTNNSEKIEENVLTMHSSISRVTRGMMYIKNIFLKRSKFEDIEPLNAAVEISISSKSLSAHYMMKIWGLKNPTIKDHWEKAIKTYSESLDQLKKSNYVKDPKFAGYLEKCEKDLAFFKIVYDQDATLGSLVDKKSDKVFKLGNEMTKIILKSIK